MMIVSDIKQLTEEKIVGYPAVEREGYASVCNRVYGKVGNHGWVAKDGRRCILWNYAHFDTEEECLVWLECGSLHAIYVRELFDERAKPLKLKRFIADELFRAYVNHHFSNPTRYYYLTDDACIVVDNRKGDMMERRFPDERAALRWLHMCL